MATMKLDVALVILLIALMKNCIKEAQCRNIGSRCDVESLYRRPCGRFVYVFSRSHCPYYCCATRLRFPFYICYQPISQSQAPPTRTVITARNVLLNGNMLENYGPQNAPPTPPPILPPTPPATSLIPRPVSNLRSTLSPASLIFLLAQLASSTSQNRGKLERTTSSRLVQTRASTAASGSLKTTISTAVVEEDPVPRGVLEFTEIPFVNSTIRTRLSCSSNRPRIDCGYPGITVQKCLSKKCCWDTRDANKFWCFYATVQQVSTVQSPSTELTPHKNRDNIGLQNKTNVKSFNNVPLVTSQKEAQTNSSSTNSALPLPSSKVGSSFRSSNNSLSPRSQQPNFETTQVYIGSVNMSGFHGNGYLFEKKPLLNSTEQKALRSRDANSSIQHSFPTTPVATTHEDILPPYTDEDANNRESLTRLSVGALSPPTPQRTYSEAEITEFLKLLDEIEKQRKPKSNSSNKKVCQLNKGDTCCKADPTGPCCEFRGQTNVAHRASPVTRIVGGMPAGSLRHSVAYLSKIPSLTHFCGGTLINRDWVLTAAHCVLEYCHKLRSPLNLLVSLGKYKKSLFLHEAGQQNFRVRKVVCHINQCKSKGYPRLNDVALIRLAWSAVITQHVAPAMLPSPHESPNPKKNCIALGWGSTRGSGYDNVMKQVSVPLVTNQKCNQPGWRNCVIRACMMCAGDVNIDACDGDSGGPLFCARSNGLYVLHGVFSWGRCGTTVRKPSVYTRTSYYITWMTKSMQSNQNTT